MTGYNSGKTPRDPYPWACKSAPYDANARYATEAEALRNARPIERVVYDPRPEFDNHNPILVDFRRLMGEIIQTHRGTESPAQAAWWVELLSEPDDVKRAWHGFDYPHTPEHLDHARRVLTKLAALTTNGVTD